MTHYFIDKPLEANTFRAIRLTMDNLIAALEDSRSKQAVSRLSKFDLVLLEKSFMVALELYAQMKTSMRIREDGRLFIYHPLEVALYVVDRLKLTDPSVVAGILLHDTLEYTPMTVAKLKRYFGQTVADIALDLSQDIDLKNEISLFGESDLVQRIRIYLPSTFAVDSVVPKNELANMAVKLEHYDRLLNRPAHKFSQLIKIADNLQAYSSIFYVEKNLRKQRTATELDLFSQYVARTAEVLHPPKQVLDDVAVVVNAWKQEGEQN